jgi:hypothetical protein
VGDQVLLLNKKYFDLILDYVIWPLDKALVTTYNIYNILIFHHQEDFMSRKIVLLAVVLMLTVPVAVFGADKLIVQDSGGVTQFNVTDDGKVGIGIGTGTIDTNAVFEIRKTGANAVMMTNRTDGAKNVMNSAAGAGIFGTLNNFKLRLVVNAVKKMELNADNSITTGSGATLTAGGVWHDASSRDYKENISELSAAAANEALKGLNPMIYNYKAAKDEKHVGFIAEDVPSLVASQDRKSLSPMDIVAVLTKVVKEQKQTVEALEATVARLEAEVNRLKK